MQALIRLALRLLKRLRFVLPVKKLRAWRLLKQNLLLRANLNVLKEKKLNGLKPSIFRTKQIALLGRAN